MRKAPNIMPKGLKRPKPPPGPPKPTSRDEIDFTKNIRVVLDKESGEIKITNFMLFG